MERTSIPASAPRRFARAFTLQGMLILGYIGLGVVLLRGPVGAGPSAGRSLVAEIGPATGADTRDTLPVLLFVFSPGDCPSCLELGRYLNRFHLSGAARVKGIVADEGIGEPALESLTGAYDLRYPVEPISGRDLARGLLWMGHDTTPITLLTDARRRVALVLPPLRDPSAHLDAVRLLTWRLQSLGPDAPDRRGGRPKRGTHGSTVPSARTGETRP